jgi:cytoskeletal protein CcmA (bactofilin family)
MVRRIKLVFLLIFLVSALANSPAQVSTEAVAVVPPIVNFNGTLQNAGNVGTVGVTFSLYKEQQGGAPLWIETQNVSVDAGGKFAVSLGANHASGVPLDLFTSGEARWLGIQPESQPEMERILIAAVPYAAKAGDAETLGGRPLSAFVLAPEVSAASLAVRSAADTPASLFSGGATTNGTAPVWVPNYMPKFLDATTLTNSTIVDTGGKIGIGTSSPESLLDIVGNSSMMVKIGNVPWAFRFGSLQSGTQFIGIAVKKSAANNNYVATSQDIATVNHTAMEFNYDGSWRIKQQNHQPDGTILNLATSLALTTAGNFGVGVNAPAQKMEVAGNIKINGTGNGIMFADGTLLKTASTGTLTGVTVGTGLTGGGTTGIASVSLDTQYTDGRYAGLATGNTFANDQTLNKSLTVKGQVLSGAHEVIGNVKIDGSGNGIVFPDGSVQTTAVAQASSMTIVAGDGMVVAGSPSAPIIGLNTGYTDARYAGISAKNVFTGDQVFNRNLSVSGALTSASQVVGGDVTASGGVSAATVQAHVSSAVAAATAVSAVVDGEDGTAIDASVNGITGATTGIHAAVASAAGTAGIFDNTASGSGTLLLGRVKIGDYWVKRFRVDGSGRVYANNGYATGGADFAESFAVAGDKTAYEPGDVLVIDPSATRRLTRASQSYSTLVAGVYSTRPGVMASPYDMDDENLKKEVPLAVVGVVPCKVSAENGPIAIGDLLVTASLPGYAMKGSDRGRMLGAVIGKALQSLDSGAGVIQILVSLQ